MPRQSRKSSQNSQNAVAEMPVHAPAEYEPGSSNIQEHVRTFLNALPMTGDVVEWIEAFREALRTMLGDVDRVVVKINTYCNLIDPEAQERRSMEIAQYPQQTGGSSETVVTSSENGVTAELLIKGLQQLGHSLEDYYPPHSYDYYFEGKAYLGTILLLRERRKPPISEQSDATMRGLESFLVFTLSDLVARHYYFRPVNRLFYDILLGLVQDVGLSTQDIRILSYMLLGYSYKQVGEKMDVTIDTVRKHMKRIYRKTRTGSLSEVFAKYFSPRFGIQGLGEDDSL